MAVDIVQLSSGIGEEFLDSPENLVNGNTLDEKSDERKEGYVNLILQYWSNFSLEKKLF